MIVVTGATGNVGRRLVHVLAAAGEQVMAGRVGGAEPRGLQVTRPGVPHRIKD